MIGSHLSIVFALTRKVEYAFHYGLSHVQVVLTPSDWVKHLFFCFNANVNADASFNTPVHSSFKICVFSK